MTKSSKVSIQEDQMKILAELRKNSSERIDTIAKNCGFSKQKVSKNINQMEKNHLIWGYTIVDDVQKQNLQKFILLLKRTDEKFDSNTLDNISRHLFKEVYTPIGVIIESSHRIHGDYDWVVIFLAPNLIEAKKFSEILFDKFPGIAKDVNLMQIIFTNRANYILNPDQTKLREFL
jgi:DNA-binding Lrp family transcriptional regulator